MQHTVLMPYSRPKNFRTLREGMEGQNVTWVPLYDSDECAFLFRDGKLPDWIKPWRGDLPKEKYTEDVLVDTRVTRVQKERPTVNPGHWMCDAFLDYQKAGDAEWMGGTFFRKDHYVSFMTDDCFWNYNYWLKLQRHFVKRTKQGEEYGPAVVMSATMLGQHVIYAGHRNDWDQFHNSTCRTFVTRFEALTVRADLLREPRFGSFWAGDGIMVERLVEENVGKMPESVVFANECICYFNGLRPECWGFPASHQR